MRTDKRTGMMKLVVAFRNFANARINTSIPTSQRTRAAYSAETNIWGILCFFNTNYTKQSEEKNRISERYNLWYICVLLPPGLRGHCTNIFFFQIGYLHCVWCSEDDKTHLMWCHLTIQFVVLYTYKGDSKLKFPSEYGICSVQFLSDYNTLYYDILTV